MPGVTAWYGLVKIIEPQAGQTMVVSAATGAVGSAFAALAKARGCHTVGIAGGPDKCQYALSELGFDACIDYKLHKDAASLSAALKEACPDGRPLLSQGDDVDDDGHRKGNGQPAVGLPNPSVPVQWDLL